MVSLEFWESSVFKKVICGYVVIFGISGIVSFQLTRKAIWGNVTGSGISGIVGV